MNSIYWFVDFNRLAAVAGWEQSCLGMGDYGSLDILPGFALVMAGDTRTVLLPPRAGVSSSKSSPASSLSTSIPYQALTNATLIRAKALDSWFAMIRWTVFGIGVL
jgi:hypothetical protein